jgi:type II secretory pathway pseudopilin PulG
MNRSTGMKWLAAGVTAAVVVSLVAAAFVIGSPMQQRQRRLDQRRTRDLADIKDSIQQYAKMHESLPPELAALGKEPGSSRPSPTDPDTRALYEYKVLDTDSFQLCAVFSLPSPGSDDPYFDRSQWTHAAGKQCFKYKRKCDSGRCQWVSAD